jgi:hypothetical protein
MYCQTDPFLVESLMAHRASIFKPCQVVKAVTFYVRQLSTMLTRKGNSTKEYTAVL